MSSSLLQPLVNIEQHNIALLFSNYLLTQQINSQVVKSAVGFDVLCQTDRLSEARQLFNEFIAHPFDQKYQQAAWQQGEITKVSSHIPPFFEQFKQQFLAHAGVVTLTVFIICWLVFLFSLLGFGGEIFQTLQFFPQLSLSLLASEPWRLLGPALFHFSWLHIAFNTMWWWQLGGEIEQKIGRGALLQIFLITAIVSNVGQFMVSGANFGGLSGVVYGLVGFIWWLDWLAPQQNLKLAKPLIGILLFWMLLGFVELLPVNMANTAHFLGLVSGCFLAWLTATSINKKSSLKSE